MAKKVENGEAATVVAGGALRPFGAAVAQVAAKRPTAPTALARKRNCIATPRMLGGSQIPLRHLTPCGAVDRRATQSGCPSAERSRGQVLLCRQVSDQPF